MTTNLNEERPIKTFFRAATLVFLLAASLLAGWQAQAEDTPKIESGSESHFESLKGRTQAEVTGSFAYSTYSGFLWDASVAGYHYIGANFGVGGELGVGDYSSTQSLRFLVAPSLEYFFNVGARSHVFFQGLFGFSTEQNATSNLELRGSGGYRYFLTENVALQAKLRHSWYKPNSSDSRFASSSVMYMRVGFSIFF